MTLPPTIGNPQIDLLPDQSEPLDGIRTQIWGLLSTLYPKVAMVERRRETTHAVSPIASPVAHVIVGLLRRL